MSSPDKPVPAAIELAERWREAGQVLAARSPELHEQMLALFATWIAEMDAQVTTPIDSVYHQT